MRRLVVAVLAGVAALVPTTAASAQSSETFSSPTRTVAGAPMFVRSVTPCAPSGGYATVTILSQIERSIVETTHADLAPDGSWVITVSAPGDMTEGITKSYYVTAECSDLSATYGLRRLYVTGFGGSSGGGSDDGGSGAAATESNDGGSLSAASAPLALATATPPVKSVRAIEAETAPAVSAPAAVDAPTTTWVSDEAERAAEARAELARQKKRSNDDVTLSAAPVVATAARPAPDAGIPWWSFVLATMLAVGAVVGFGQRRRSSL